MKRFIKNIVPAAAMLLAVGLNSCVGDLDVDPIDPNLNSQIEPEQLFNKCYACFAVAGNGGANGDSDVDGIDGGTSGYVRQMFNANELTTDEAICGWGDEGISSFCYNTYDASHPMLRGYYYRLYTSIAFCNQYLTEFSEYDAAMTAEIRFIRALDYFFLMDGWGNIPFTEVVSSAKPEQYSRQQVYEFVEKELLELEPSLNEARAKKSSDSGYGRVDKAAAWLLLARLYLNAEIYTGSAQWAKAAEYAKKVMDSPYKLNTTGSGKWTAYQMLFMGDNGETSAATEAVFPLLQDGLLTTSWGTSLFLIASTFDGDMFENPNDANATNGTTEAWGGNRARPQLLQKFFPDLNVPTGKKGYELAQLAGDDRALINTDGERTLDNLDPSVFKSGYAVAKFTNFKTDGSSGHSAQFPDADFFLMRSAEAYLTYAEATARQNGGKTNAEGTQAINTLRARSHAASRAAYTLDEILDEWSREFYFEGRRRMDLIRFGAYGGSSTYNWQWKGGAFEGRSFSADKNLFAIPTTDLIANENLTQNPGY